MNLRAMYRALALNRTYYPDFVAVDNKDTRWRLETKGARRPEMLRESSNRRLRQRLEHADKLTDNGLGCVSAARLRPRNESVYWPWARARKPCTLILTRR